MGNIRKFLFGVCILISLLSCHKLCTPRQLILSGGVANVYPDKDSIRVGDTLWFSCVIPAAGLKYVGDNSSDSVSYNINGATNLSTDLIVEKDHKALTPQVSINELKK